MCHPSSTICRFVWMDGGLLYIIFFFFVSMSFDIFSLLLLFVCFSDINHEYFNNSITPKKNNLTCENGNFADKHQHNVIKCCHQQKNPLTDNNIYYIVVQRIWLICFAFGLSCQFRFWISINFWKSSNKSNYINYT